VSESLKLSNEENGHICETRDWVRQKKFGVTIIGDETVAIKKITRSLRKDIENIKEASRVSLA